MAQRVYLAGSIILGLSGVLLLLGSPATEWEWVIAGSPLHQTEWIRTVGGLLFGLGLSGISRSIPGGARGHHG